MDRVSALRLPPGVFDEWMTVVRPLAATLSKRTRAGTPLAAALCGAQGSGKSTVTTLLAEQLRHAHGLRVASLSLDDLYLTRRDREALARDVHPMLETRGVPGTHDLPLAARLFDALLSPHAGEVALPAFDKARDDRAPETQFEVVRGPLDVVLLEGWCVGAVAEPAEALEAPINDFERECDPDGRLRRHVNEQLAGPYRALFARFGWLAMLEAPDMACVTRWRTEQEHALSRRLREAGEPDTTLRDAEVAAFVARFERLTRHMLREMPGRADVVVELDQAHRVHAVRTRETPR